MATWRTTLPGETNSFADMPTICQDQFGLISAAFGREHKTFNEAGCGTHLALPGITKSASTVILNALSSPGSGAMAWDTTVGWWKRYWQSAWNYPGSGTKWSRVRAHKSGDHQELMDVDWGTQTETITFQTEDYDSLGEFSSNTFTPIESGCYLVAAAWAASGVSMMSQETSSTYPLTAVSEGWTAAWTSRPTADVLAELITFPTPGGNHYAQIDESTCSTTDGVSSTGATNDDKFQHTKFAIPAGATIHNVQVISKAQRSAGSNTYLANIRVGTNWYNGTYRNTPVTPDYLVDTWAVNPATSLAWTVDQVNEAAANALSGFGFSLVNGMIYQSYLQVNYTLANNNYANVDESTANENDIIWATTDNTMEIFSAGPMVYLPTTSCRSISATIYVRAKCITATGVSIGAVLRCGTTNYSGTYDVALTDSWQDYGWYWDNNPATSTEWTSGDFAGVTSNSLSGFGFYVRNTGSTPSTAQICQAVLQYDWECPEPSMSILLRKGGAVTSSATVLVNESAAETDAQVKLVDMVYLTAGQTLDVQAQKTLIDDIILSGSDLTYVAIHRLGSQGM